MSARARLVDARTRPERAPLTDAQARKANRRVAKIAATNPLRRIRTGCCGWVRDTVAVAGDHVWCDTHADWTRVLEHAA